jgi:Cysteine-rich CWC
VIGSKTGIEPSFREPSQKNCERCKAVFACGAHSEACWCESVELSSSVLADLRVRFDDCLCPACLMSNAEPFS